MALVLKSNNSYIGGNRFPEFDLYKARVLADGGVINNTNSLLDAFMYMLEFGIKASEIISATSANWGCKVVGGNVTKLYSLYGADGDLTAEGGEHPLVLKNGVNGMYSTGTKTGKFTCTKNITSLNQSLFTAFSRNPALATSGGILSEIHGTDNVYKGINQIFNFETQSFSSNGYGTTGVITGIPNADNFSTRIALDGLVGYTNGVKKAEDTIVRSNLLGENFKYVLAGSETGRGASGDYFAAIAAVDLSLEKTIALSKFVANFV